MAYCKLPWRNRSCISERRYFSDLRRLIPTIGDASGGAGGGGGGRIRIEAVMGDIFLPTVIISGIVSDFRRSYSSGGVGGGAQNGTYTSIFQSRGYCRTSITSGVLPITSGPVTTGIAAPVTTGTVAPVVTTGSGDITTNFVTTSPVTTGETTGEVEITTIEATTGVAEGIQGTHSTQ